jgi:hypothetical protein
MLKDVGRGSTLMKTGLRPDESHQWGSLQAPRAAGARLGESAFERSLSHNGDAYVRAILKPKGGKNGTWDG